ncbi:MAG TPA: peptidoglycan-binding domain-containing protein [Acidimicrobiales bacterium]|nr:peptidoglycan-binding domain-containing protein [Acidimicrobiales bacterium]
MAISDELALAWADHVGAVRADDGGAAEFSDAPALLDRIDADARRVVAYLDAWRRDAEVRLDRARVAVRPMFDDPTVQQRVARGLGAVVVSIAVLGMIAALSLPTRGLAGGPDHPMAQRPGGSQAAAPANLALAAAAVAGTPPAAPIPPAALPAPDPTIPAARGPLPVGKGMWMWLPEKVEGGNPEATVLRAREMGLSHIYVRTGSSKMGFYAQQYLNDFLPRAHAAGIRIYGWDFPYLFDPGADIARSMQAITYTTPDGHRIDGFAPDIETRGEGVNIGAAQAAAYTNGLRAAVGPAYPLIAVVPRPNPALVTYPFAEVVAPFDAIAPMVYWMNRDPGADIAGAMATLSQYGKPIIPIGQAYDGHGEGGPPGVPNRGQIQRFMQVAEENGAIGVSFWSWQHANAEAWHAIRDGHWFTLPATPAGAPVGFTAGQIRAYQGLLTSLGFPVASDGVWGPATIAAVSAYQEAARLPKTGVVDHLTRRVLLTPFNAPIKS